MVAAVERIERDIAALEKVMAATAEEFHDTYNRYLTLLGQAVRQQLIQAAYHLCTQGYPEQFLRLSLSQRQQLQKALRQLCQHAQGQLLNCMKAREMGSQAQEEAATSEFSSLEATLDSTGSENGEGTGATEEMDGTEEAEKAEATGPNPIHGGYPQSPFHPKVLGSWQEQLEQAVLETLQTISHMANQILQQARVIPAQLPVPLLEVAAKSESSLESSPGVPNILNLLIGAVAENLPESLRSEALEDSENLHLPPNVEPIQIMIVYLRLSDIEFTDSTVMAWRTKIRSLASRVKMLGREYHKKQHERAIAEAEMAWRTSWFEE
ncbi:MAG: hypothetical protein VKJ46_06060 [Leptolyngbyaceae bacterium]|nr:hypothetical protein [Leptolyngbyaceae bacterium]